MKKVDLFDQAPEFLAAFNNIATNGFFEQITFTFGDKMAGGEPFKCFIEAAGCIPSSEKYRKEGIRVLMKPEDVIASCRAITGRHKVKEVSVTVQTGDWPLYDKDGENVIGSKGTRTDMRIYIRFFV
jgi:hypothetical protein